MNRQTIQRWVWNATALLLVAALSACGGGGGGPSSGGEAGPDTVAQSQTLSEVPAVSSLASALSANAVGADNTLRVATLTKLSETRVTRTVYDYAFRVTLTNGTATNLASASVFVDGVGAGTTVIDNASHVGTLPAGATLAAPDTIVLRHDRTRPFDANALRWKFQSRAAVNPGPIVASVTQAAIKPAVVVADGRLTPSVNPLVLVDESGAAWPRDRLVVVGGNVFKVVGSSTDRAGRTLVSVEGRPFHEAFEKLAFKASFGALLYDAQGAPLVPASNGVKAPLGAGRGRLAAGLTTDELRAKLGLAACITPGQAAEIDPESVGYTFGIRCSLADLLRLPGGAARDALSTLWVDGSLVNSAKSTYVFDLEKRDNYVEETRQFDGLITAHVNVADVVRQAARGIEACKVDGEDVTCEVTLAESKAIPFPIAVVGGVAVNAEFQLKWVFQMTLTGDMQVSYGVRSKVVRVSGQRGGVSINHRSAPETQLYQPVTATGWEAGLTGGIDESTSLGFELKLGTVAYSPVSVAQIEASLGAYVRAKAVKDILRGTGICLSHDKGLVLAGSVNFLPAEALGFDGIPLVDEDVRIPIGDVFSLPSGCADDDASGRLKFLYRLYGAEFHTLVAGESGANRDVFRISGAWLQKKLAATEPATFVVDLENLLVASRLPASKLAVTAGVPVKPEGSGARAEVEWRIRQDTGAKYPVVVIYSGTTKPGQSLTAAITVSVPGQPDRTVNKQIKLDMEPTLDAAPTYRHFVKSDGYEGYTVLMNFKGLTQTLARQVRVELSNGETQVVDRAKALDPAGQVYEYMPDWAWVSYRVENSMGVFPVALLLDSDATVGKSSSYRVPIGELRDVKVNSPFTITPTPAYVGDTLTLEISGDSLPNKEPEYSGDDQRLIIELRANFPACKDFVEIRDPALERKGLYSTEYRKIKCVARAVAMDTRIDVFDGQGYGTAFVGLDPNQLIQVHVSPTSPSVFEQVMLWVSEVYSTVKSVVWAFADATLRQVAEVVNGVSTAVSMTFSSPGTVDGRVVFKDQSGGSGNTLGSQTFSIDVRPAAPALPAAPVLSQALIRTDGTAQVSGTAAPGVGVRITWPDNRTDSALAAATTGAFNFERSAQGLAAGGIVVVVAYNNAGSSAVATLALAKVVASDAVLREDFNGTAIDETKWTRVGFSQWDNQPNGPVTVSNGVAQFGAFGRLSSKGKVHVSGSKIVIETRMAGLGASRDTGIYLIDTDETVRNWLVFGDTSYWGGMYLQAYGVYAGNAPFIHVNSATSTNQWMEYRLTIEGDQMKVERGVTLANINPAETLSVKLARSIAGRSFYLHIGTGGSAYSPGSIDWLEVRADGALAGSAQTLEAAFTGASTPSAPWSFGWQTSAGAAPTAYGKFTPAGTRTDFPTLAMWNKGDGNSPASVYPYVYKNTGASSVSYRADVTDFPSQSLVVTPGSAGERAVFRWTAPASGAYEISARFELMQGGSVDVHVQKNGADLFVNQIAGKGSVASAPVQTVALNAGDVIDFAVGDGGNGQNSDITQVSAAVRAAPSQRISNPANGRVYELITCGTWLQCRDEAKLRGGRLATIRSAAENDWIAANLLPQATSIWGFWIGFNDRAKDGFWVWDSGEPIPYTNWSTWYNPNPNAEDAAHMVKQWGGTWNDTPAADAGITQGLVEYDTGAVGEKTYINVMNFKPTSLNIATDLTGDCRLGLVYNGPPYTLRPNTGEWDVVVAAAGTYSISVEYSAAESRPVRASMDGVSFNASALAAVNGTWCASPLMIESLGQVQLSAGAHVLKLERDGVFPHLRRIWLTRLQ